MEREKISRRGNITSHQGKRNQNGEHYSKQSNSNFELSENVSSPSARRENDNGILFMKKFFYGKKWFFSYYFVLSYKLCSFSFLLFLFFVEMTNSYENSSIEFSFWAIFNFREFENLRYERKCQRRQSNEYAWALTDEGKEPK